jgi:glycogen operon protein
LLVFKEADDARPFFEYQLNPTHNRTGDVWHVRVNGIGPGSFYLWKMDGPYLPEKGHRFNPNKALIDPYAKALTHSRVNASPRCLGYVPGREDADLSFSALDDVEDMPKCVVVDDEDFDWQGDTPLNYPLRFSVLYETHVRGLTRHPSSGAEHPGTYKGVIERIPYFKQLGVTSLEFLPVQEFDEDENPRHNPRTGERLKNYWGYSTIAFFAPKGSFAASGSHGQQVAEFKEMVRELHKAGIEVILDIVFNHTAEGNEMGPTLSFRGLDNSIYYLLEDKKRFYKNYSGCGNTLNCNHPVLRTFIIECLRYWVVEMHVDGFRFDLGSILGRDQRGNLMENPPILERIAEDPILRNTKIIAEAWDAGGAYQVGWFPGGRWAEWNDRFRDDVRRFWAGEERMIQSFATRLTGSSDLYLRDGRKPFHSINFVTSHDGFTLNDLVSYERKHNEENGERNRDGHGSNHSRNYGFEGPASNPQIERIRRIQIKNFLGTLFLSLGTPMMLGGDEFRRTQRGNNNAYCQDNEVSWYDWGLLRQHADIWRFTRLLIDFRRRHPALHRPEFFTGMDSDYNAIPDITWFDEAGGTPDWARPEGILAARLDGSKADILSDRDDNDFYLIFNATDKLVNFKVCPAPGGKHWYRAIDSAYESPLDILEHGAEEILIPQEEYVARPSSLAVFISRIP